MNSQAAIQNTGGAPKSTWGFARGFTLTELMVVIALTGLLLAILVPVLAFGERSARATEELNAARQLLRGYTTSSEDAKGRLMVGYLSEDQDDPDWEGNYDVLGPDGTQLEGREKRRWTWRLLPYLDNAVEALFIGQGLATLDATRGTEDFAYTLSVHPSFGLNAEWLGGIKGGSGIDDLHTLGKMTGETYYAERRAQVRKPSQQLVFASSFFALEGSQYMSNEGYFLVSSPWYHTTGWRWNTSEDAGEKSFSMDPANSWRSGFISARHGDRAATAMLDGHTELESLLDLADMRRWSNDAWKSDWVLEPPSP